MNDIVLILVVIAALVLVGLFVWNRMETNKGEKGAKPGLGSMNTENIYGRLTDLVKPKTPAEEKPAVPLVAEESTPARAEPVVVTAPEPEQKPEVAPVTVPEVKVEPKIEVPAEPVHKPEVVQIIPPVKPVEPVKPEQEVLPFSVMTDDEEKEEAEEPVTPKPFIPKEGLKQFDVDPLMETVGMIHATKPILGSLMLEMANNLKKLGLPIRVYVRRAETSVGTHRPMKACTRKWQSCFCWPIV